MKGLDFIIKKTASDQGIPEAQVKLILNAYWMAISKKMTSLESMTLTLRNIGNITISKKKLGLYILRKIKSLRTIKSEPDRYGDPEKVQRIRENFMAQLKQALFHRNELAKQYKIGEDKRREQIRNKRLKNESSKNT